VSGVVQKLQVPEIPTFFSVDLEYFESFEDAVFL
jgi:hypothetical protein